MNHRDPQPLMGPDRLRTRPRRLQAPALATRTHYSRQKLPRIQHYNCNPDIARRFDARASTLTSETLVRRAASTPIRMMQGPRDAAAATRCSSVERLAD